MHVILYIYILQCRSLFLGRQGLNTTKAYVIIISGGSRIDPRGVLNTQRDKLAKISIIFLTHENFWSYLKAIWAEIFLVFLG